MNRPTIRFAFAAAVLAVSGCAGVSHLAMVPSTARTEPMFAAIPSGIRVDSVTGGVDPSVDRRAAVSDNHLRQALQLSLEAIQSGGVGRHANEPTLALDLRARIIGQRSTKDSTMAFMFEHRKELIVQYELVDRATRRVTWQGTYSSEYGSSLSGGNDRVNDAVQGSVRENIDALLRGMANHFQKAAPAVPK